LFRWFGNLKCVLDRAATCSRHERVLELATGIDADDLARMEAAIEEGCEEVEPDEW
jgi:hypothetical protein